MTPKEKAKELISTYNNIIIDLNRSIRISSVTVTAKKCALIAVDEILEALPESDSNYLDFQMKEESINYWNDVKTEINKL